MAYLLPLLLNQLRELVVDLILLLYFVARAGTCLGSWGPVLSGYARVRVEDVGLGAGLESGLMVGGGHGDGDETFGCLFRSIRSQ